MASRAPTVSDAKQPSPETRRTSRSFTLRKLHSLSGVVPIGVFLILHLAAQSSALRGRAAYDASVARADALPLQPLLELVLVVLPLLFHASYGLVLTARSRPTVSAHPTHRNWMYTAQRITGVVAFFWIVWHAGETWVPRWLGHVGAEQVYPTLVADLSSTVSGLPLIAIAYVIGIGASSFHLANGLWGAAVSWGLLVTRRAQSIASAGAVVLGLLLFLVGTNVTVHFATGAGLVVIGAPLAPEPEVLCEPGSPPTQPTTPAAPR